MPKSTQVGAASVIRRKTSNRMETNVNRLAVTLKGVMDAWMVYVYIVNTVIPLMS